MSKATMATRGLAETGTTVYECTEFSLHISQQPVFPRVKKKLIDYTERRLMKYAQGVTDPQQRSVLVALLKDYQDGKVAVAWRSGYPVHFKVTKDGV